MEIFAIRQAKLRRLIEEQFDGNQAKFAMAMEAKAPQINRWLSNKAEDRRNITEKSARRIERAAQRPTGWLDTPSDDGAYSADNRKEHIAREDGMSDYKIDIPALTNDEYIILSGYRIADKTRKEDMIQLAKAALQADEGSRKDNTKAKPTPILGMIRSALDDDKTTKTTK